MQLKLVSSTGDEPISLATAKAYLRVKHTVEDTLILQIIRSARSLFERAGRISILQNTYDCSYIQPRVKPTDFGINSRIVDPDSILHTIDLPHGPVRSVESIAVANAGGTTIIPTSSYSFDIVSGIIRFSIPMPLDCGHGGRSVVRYTAGYDQEGGDVLFEFPDDLKGALLDTISEFYDTRQMQRLPLSATIILSSYWRPY